MQPSEIRDYARQLFAQMGPKAIAMAAQKATGFEERGETDEAEKWRRIEQALLEQRGPRQS